MCGNYLNERLKILERLGSPPRVRELRVLNFNVNNFLGITPACAGITTDFSSCVIYL